MLKSKLSIRFRNVSIGFATKDYFSVETKLRFKMWDDIWRFYKRHVFLINGVTGIGCAGLAVWLWKFAGKNDPLLPSFGSPTNRIVHSFEVGSGLEQFMKYDSKADVPREDLKIILTKIFSNEQISPRFILIVGESGTGKSTAVRQVMASLEGPKGVYINCPPSHQFFSIEMARLIGFEPEVDSRGGLRRKIEESSKNVTRENEPTTTFEELFPSLIDAARKFEAKYNRPMLLVIDSMNVLIKNDPKFAELLLNVARECTNQKIIRFVFISSDSSALPFMMSRSAWSRGSLLEIGEICDEDAVGFLKANGVSESLAKQAVLTLTGGLFRSLEDFLHQLKIGMNLEAQIDFKESTVKSCLRRLGIPPTHEDFQFLLTHRSIEYHKAKLTDAEITSLLDLNILSIHTNSSLTFHDRGVEHIFKERLGK